MDNERNRTPSHVSEVPGCIGGLIVDLIKVGGPVVGVGLVVLVGAGMIDRAGIDSSQDLMSKSYGNNKSIVTPDTIYPTATPETNYLATTPQGVVATDMPNPESICTDTQDEIGQTTTFIDNAGNQVTGAIFQGAEGKTYVIDQNGSGLVMYCNNAVERN